MTVDRVTESVDFQDVLEVVLVVILVQHVEVVFQVAVGVWLKVSEKDDIFVELELVLERELVETGKF